MNFKKLPTAGLIVVENNKLLLTYSKNKKAWYLPGGKIDAGESSKEGLIREVEEELNLILEPHQLEYCFHITAMAYGEQNLLMEQDCFKAEIHQEIKPSNEIEAFQFFSREDYLKEEIQVEGVLIAFDLLAL